VRRRITELIFPIAAFGSRNTETASFVVRILSPNTEQEISGCGELCSNTKLEISVLREPSCKTAQRIPVMQTEISVLGDASTVLRRRSPAAEQRIAVVQKRTAVTAFARPIPVFSVAALAPSLPRALLIHTPEKVLDKVRKALISR
jgi:hypothetical protein